MHFRIRLRLIAAMVFGLTLGLGASAQTAGPIVKVEGGQVQGAANADIQSFKGIPYAAPPVSALRWRPPQPVIAWRGVRASTEPGNGCSQKPVPGDPATAGGRKFGEDCLVLNVWRPASIGADVKLPVLVWIHGGGYVNGSSSAPIFDGSAFARQGLVFVSFNYRLGRLGFFAHPALLEATEGPVGNFGYMDQLQALRWVQKNIEAFGGDRDQVTIAGESAGGYSVIHLLTSPVARGLFDRAIVMSGGGRRSISDRKLRGGKTGNPSTDQLDAAFAKSIGIEGSGTPQLNALRSLQVERLVGDLNLQSMLQSALKCPALLNVSLDAAAKCTPAPFEGVPMMDGEIVTNTPEKRFLDDKAAKVPLLIGTTATDLPLYFPPSLANPFVYFGVDAAKAQAAYGVPAGADGKALFTALLSISADMTMHEQARFAARQMTAHGNPAWLYRFTYVAESKRPAPLGQAHAGELPFMFQTLEAIYGDQATAKDRRAAKEFSAYIANFARTGDPNGASLPRWPQFDPSRWELMDFTDNGPVFGPEPRKGVPFVERAADSQIKSD
jgi:para-nitrobenzyl esterase